MHLVLVAQIFNSSKNTWQILYLFTLLCLLCWSNFFTIFSTIAGGWVGTSSRSCLDSSATSDRTFPGTPRGVFPVYRTGRLKGNWRLHNCTASDWVTINCINPCIMQRNAALSYLETKVGERFRSRRRRNFLAAASFKITDRGTVS